MRLAAVALALASFTEGFTLTYNAFAGALAVTHGGTAGSVNVTVCENEYGLSGHHDAPCPVSVQPVVAP